MAQTQHHATRDAASLGDELLALENRSWQALKNNDLKTALALTDEPCIIAGAQGVASVNKEQFAEVMRSAHFRIEDVYISPDAQVRQLNDDTAVLAYNVRERVTIDGKSVTMEAVDASTWVRRDGRWLCAMHTESIKGDPFGRDRTAT